MTKPTINPLAEITPESFFGTPEENVPCTPTTESSLAISFKPQIINVNNESIKRKKSFKFIKMENICSNSVKSFCGIQHLSKSNIVSANSILNEIIKEKDQNAYLLNLIFFNLVKQHNHQKTI